MYEIKRRVGVSQIGLEGLLSRRSALDHMCDCCQFQVPVLADGKFQQFLRDQHLGMFLIYRQVDFYRMPAYGEEIAIATMIYECRNFYGFRNTTIRDASGKLCIGGYAVGAFVNLDTGRPQNLPPDVIETMANDPKMEETEYTPRKIRIPEVPPENILPPLARTVSVSQLDFNRHLNSNWYVSFAEELLPKDFPCRRLRIEYKQQAKPGTNLLIQGRKVSDQQFIVTIGDDQGVLHAVLEYT